MRKLEYLAAVMYYFRVGFSYYLSIPVAIIGYATSIYYLAVKNIPFLEMIFPSFIIFTLSGTLGVFVVSVIFGYWYFKRSPIYSRESRINTESNPYNTKFTTPISIPVYKAIANMARRNGDLETAGQLDEIVKISQAELDKAKGKPS